MSKTDPKPPNVATILCRYKEFVDFKWSSKQVLIATNPDLLEELLNASEIVVKGDKRTKKCVLIVGFSAFVDSLNMDLSGGSGSGKSYITVNILVIPFKKGKKLRLLGGLTKKAIYHMGRLVDEQGNPIEFSEKPKEPKRKDFKEEEKFKEALAEFKKAMHAWNERIEKSYQLVDLSDKIYVLLEAPDEETFQTLLPIMSHDVEEIEYSFTDKDTMRTVRVVIRGQPVWFFLGTRPYMETVLRRCIGTSPETSQEKIENAQKVTTKKANDALFDEELSLRFQDYQTYFENVRDFVQKLDGSKIIVPFLELQEIFPKTIIRDMSDWNYFIRVVKAMAVLHCFQRPIWISKEGKIGLMATKQDVIDARELYNEIFETSRTGATNELLDFYNEVLTTKLDKEGTKIDPEWTVDEIAEKWNCRQHKPIGTAWMREKLALLSTVLDKRDNPHDKRSNIYVPIAKKVQKEELQRSTLENETVVISGFNFENSFEKWLNEYKGKYSTYAECFFSDGKLGFREITIEKLKELVNSTSVSPASSPLYLSTPEAKPIPEDKPENTAEPKTAILPRNPAEDFFGTLLNKKKEPETVK